MRSGSSESACGDSDAERRPQPIPSTTGRGPTGRYGRYPALRSADYRKALVAQFCLEAGLTVFEVALLWVGVQANDSLAGVLYAILVLPGSVMATVVGRLTDSRGSRPLLATSALVGTTVAAGGSAVMFFTSPGIAELIALALGAGLCLGLWSVPAQVFLGRVVDPVHAASAIGLGLLPSGLGALAGGLLGGFVLHALGSWQTMATAAGLLLIAALTVFRLPHLPRADSIVPAPTRLIDTTRWMLAQPVILTLMALAAVVSLFLVGRTALFPLMVRDIIHGGANDLGLLVGANGLGSLLGSLITDRTGQVAGRGRLVLLGMITAALSLGALGVSGVLVASLALTAVCAISMILFQSTSAMVVQLSAPSHGRGALVGAFDVTRLALIPAGTVVLGFVADALGVTAACLLAGGVTLVAALIAAASGPGLRHLRSLPAEQPTS